MTDEEILKLVLYMVTNSEIKTNMVAYTLISRLENKPNDLNDLLKSILRSDNPRSERILNKIIEKF